MRNLIPFFLTLFIFISCKKNQEEKDEMNSFLKVNYEFNNRILNQHKGDYYVMIEEQPDMKVEKLNELYLKYELLISDIDKAIITKESNFEKIISEYHYIINEIPKIVNNREDYLLPEFEPKSDLNEFHLITMKNRLVIAMAYAFEYAGKSNYFADGFRVLSNVITNVSNIENNGRKITLSSDIVQIVRENRQIIINKIQFNGEEKEIKYTLNENYSFTDIVLDSLQKGKYQLEGILRLHERNGNIDIPFNEKFEVE